MLSVLCAMVSTILRILRDTHTDPQTGHLHLHPVSETHQLRPTLTYLDVLSRKSKRKGAESDEESDDGPPPDPDEPAPAPPPKKEKKPVGDAKDVQVSVRKAEDKSGMAPQGGLSTVRREMLATIRAEEDEAWQDYEFHGAEVSIFVDKKLLIFLRLPLAQTTESEEAYEALIGQQADELECKTNMTTFLKTINGLP